MNDQLTNDESSGEVHLEISARSSKRRGRKTGRSSENQVRAGLIQVSAQVPREVIAAFDRQSSLVGVNRQHLIREALTAYAALLDAGCRVYQVPGLERRQERAA